MATSINREVRGPLSEREVIAEGAGLRRGVPVTTGTTTAYGVIADALGEDCQGIQTSEGQLPDGAANYGQDSTRPAEQILVAKKGIVRALVPTAQTITKGMQAIANASGRMIARTAYSFSAFVHGIFDETITTTTAQYVSLELRQQLVELVRPVSVSQPLKTTVLGAATVYGSGIGLAFSAAPVMLYRARFTGEKVRNLSVSLVTAPGGADTVAATVMKSADNGDTWSALAVTCTISAAAKTATDLVNTATLDAGDIIGIRFVSSAGTAAGAVATTDVT